MSWLSVFVIVVKLVMDNLLICASLLCILTTHYNVLGHALCMWYIPCQVTQGSARLSLRERAKC